MQVRVPPVLRPYLDAALTRLRYLYPSVSFNPCDGHIEVDHLGALSCAVLTKEINYALYREKIYAETLPLRQELISGLMRG